MQAQQEQLQMLKEELSKRDRQIDEAREEAASATLLGDCRGPHVIGRPVARLPDEDPERLALREAIGLGMIVQLREPGGVPRSEGKAVRVIDKRVTS